MLRATSSLIITPEEQARLLKLFPKGIVAVDLETTGLSPLVDKIIEIAALKITPNDEVVTFHALINPLIEIPQHTIQYHQITDDMVANVSTLKKPLKDFWDFVGNLPLLAHNAVFDIGFLIKGSHDFQIETAPTKVYDSCRFLRSLYRSKPEGSERPDNFKLSTLATYFKVELKHHIALEDTMTCALVFARGLMAQKEEAEFEKHFEKSFVLTLRQYKNDDPFFIPKKFDDLKVMVASGKIVEIQYKGGHQGDDWRPVRPIGLLPMPSGPVLMGECLLSGLNKSFLLKKIKNIREKQDAPTNVGH